MTPAPQWLDTLVAFEVQGEVRRRAGQELARPRLGRPGAFSGVAHRGRGLVGLRRDGRESMDDEEPCRGVRGDSAKVDVLDVFGELSGVENGDVELVRGRPSK
jgi:hypothetical protein